MNYKKLSQLLTTILVDVLLKDIWQCETSLELVTCHMAMIGVICFSVSEVYKLFRMAKGEC